MLSLCPHAVLFDLDGTIADTAPDLLGALNRLLARYQRPALSLAQTRHEASNGALGMLRAGFGVTAQDADYAALRQDFIQLYAEHLCDQTRLFDGIEELLARLEQERLPWGIVTNKPVHLARPLVAALGLAPAVLLGGDSSVRPKPAPDALELACAHLRATPEHCIYIGDARRDIEAGQAAGMRTVVAAFGYLSADDDPHTWGADRVAARPQDLLPALPPQADA